MEVFFDIDEGHYQDLIKIMFWYFVTYPELFCICLKSAFIKKDGGHRPQDRIKKAFIIGLTSWEEDVVRMNTLSVPDTSNLRLSEKVRRYEKKTVKKDEAEKVRGKCSVCCDVFGRLVRAFLCSRWMGLVLGPVYGVLIYLYVTHLFLAGAPFTKSNFLSSGDNSSRTSQQPNSCGSGGFNFNPDRLFDKQGLADKVTGDKSKTGAPRVYVEDPDFAPIMSKMTSHYIGAGIGGAIGGGLFVVSPFNKRTRCSMVLMLPSLLTKRGRGFMLTFVTSLVLSGPVNTMQYNLQELVRAFTCMYCQVKAGENNLLNYTVDWNDSLSRYKTDYSSLS